MSQTFVTSTWNVVLSFGWIRTIPTHARVFTLRARSLTQTVANRITVVNRNAILLREIFRVLVPENAPKSTEDQGNSGNKKTQDSSSTTTPPKSTATTTDVSFTGSLACPDKITNVFLKLTVSWANLRWSLVGFTTKNLHGVSQFFILSLHCAKSNLVPLLLMAINYRCTLFVCLICSHCLETKTTQL